MEKNQMLVPLLASVGIGAATYYTMTKNNQSVGQTGQKVGPSSAQTIIEDKQTLGPYGMS
ncbi:hypothetical protein VBD025_09080 [Virgibacillus flavescens]|uniref:hypothetical protein n=1 Tax=Virgibacillus flavescens TaxID=1611422 RepID=UPI003D341031